MSGNRNSGRNPLPKEEKLKRGTLRKSRENKEPIHVKPLTKMPPPPSGTLGKSAAAIWRSDGAELIKRGTLSSADLSQFEMYCYYAGQWRDAVYTVEQEGTVTTKGKPNHLLKVAKDAFENAFKIGSAFGLNPISRPRIGATELVKEPSSLDKI